MRLDVWLSENGVKSREEAKRLILAGAVEVKGKKARPSLDVGEEDVVTVLARSRYVSRGGYKLEAAVEHFNISVEGLCCLDIGASTGGFTDCLLQRGAAFVYALDVGHGQLDESIAKDDRVCSLEGVNIRNVEAGDFERDIDFICCDVSFISLKLVLPVIYRVLKGKHAAVLIKPQFECGKSGLGKGGIVKSDKVAERVKEDIKAFARMTGFDVTGIIPSPIKGGDGNREFLMVVEK